MLTRVSSSYGLEEGETEDHVSYESTDAPYTLRFPASE
jgi:hypothetical protein